MFTLDECPDCKVLKDDLERERVRLDGCIIAAEGSDPSPPLEQNQWGWSPAYQRVVELRAERDKLAALLNEWVICIDIAGWSVPDDLHRLAKTTQDQLERGSV